LSTEPETGENRSDIILCQTEDGQSRLEVRLEDETVWLAQSQIAEHGGGKPPFPTTSMHRVLVFSF
jgi:hypothetical protein